LLTANTEAAPARKTIVVLEDEPVARTFFQKALEPMYDVRAYSCLEDASGQLESADLIVSDWEMPGAGGAGLLVLLDQMASPPPVVIVSALSIFDTRLEMARQRNLPFLSKPLSLRNLRSVVRDHLPGTAAANSAI
jgi:DNA-binding NtrC family response regulator